MRNSALDRITISELCNANWDSMAGNDQVRFCGHCSLPVNDLSQMTRAEAMGLVAESRGRLCVRYVQLPRGEIITRDMPATLYRIGRRASRVAAGAFTAALSLSSAPAQSRLTNNDPNQIIEMVQSMRQRQLLVDEFNGGLSGTVKAIDGTPVSDVDVILVDQESGQERKTMSSTLGIYEFQLVPAGIYLLWARKQGFQTSSDKIHLDANTRLRQDVELRGRRMVLMGAMGMRVQAEADDPLAAAVTAGDAEKVRALAYNDPDLNSPERSHEMPLLADAVQQGNREIVGILLAADARVNVRTSDGRTALMSLTDKATVELVRDLLSAGANVNARDDFGNDALINAASVTGTAVLKEIIMAGAHVDATNRYGETALFFAARGNSAEAVTLLLNSGAQMNTRNEDDETPLLAMANSGSFETFKTLINHGAAIQLANVDGLTPLMNAAMNEDPRLVRLLLEAGADVNAYDERHGTAIMYAAQMGREASVELLALAGADVNAQDYDGETALFEAVNRGQIESVRALLKAGADITIRDNKGKTALARAQENEQKDIEKLLRLHGAHQ